MKKKLRLKKTSRQYSWTCSLQDSNKSSKQNKLALHLQLFKHFFNQLKGDGTDNRRLCTYTQKQFVSRHENYSSHTDIPRLLARSWVGEGIHQSQTASPQVMTMILTGVSEESSTSNTQDVTAVLQVILKATNVYISQQHQIIANKPGSFRLQEETNGL